MDILVFVKQVPDDSVEIHLDGAGVPAVKDIEKVTNAFDTYALELAARYTEANGGEVTVAAIGTEDCTSMMKNLLAVGAKKAYLFKDDVFAGADEGATAAYLAKVVKKCEAENGQPYGMILCGKESTDEISGQVGARLAEILGIGFVSSVIEVEPQDESLVAKQETEEGYIRYSVAQPAVFTIAKPSYDPRYPNIKAKLAARKAVVPVFSAADAEVSAAEAKVSLKGYSETPKRTAGVRIKEKEAAEAVRKAMEKMLQDKAL